MYRSLEPDAIVTFKSGHQAMVELDGPQHFRSISFGGPPTDFHDQVCRDLAKNHWAFKSSMSILRVSYKEYNNIEKWLERFIHEVEAKGWKQNLLVSNAELYNQLKKDGPR